MAKARKAPAQVPFPKLDRKQLAAARGLRPATKAELAAFGKAAGSRQYVPIGKPLFTKAGKPRKGAGGFFVPRRKAEEQLIGRSYEALADRRAAVTGGRTRMNRYKTLLSTYAESTGLTKGEARRSAEFKQIVKDLRTKSLAPTGRKARALVLMGRRDPSWTWDVGDTPEIIPAGDYDVAHYDF